MNSKKEMSIFYMNMYKSAGLITDGLPWQGPFKPPYGQACLVENNLMHPHHPPPSSSSSTIHPSTTTTTIIFFHHTPPPPSFSSTTTNNILLLRHPPIHPLHPIHNKGSATALEKRQNSDINSHSVCATCIKGNNCSLHRYQRFLLICTL